VTLEIQVTSAGEPVIAAGPIDLPILSENGDSIVFSADNLPDLAGQSEFLFGGTVTVSTNIYAGGKRLSPNLSIDNTAAGDLEFTIRLSWSTLHAGGVNWNTAAAWQRETSGVLFSLPESSMWTVRLDDQVVGTLYDDPSGLAGAGPASLTTDPINGADGPIEADMTVDLGFLLSPGTASAVVGTMLVTPCQSCLADSNCDGVINLEDLLALLGRWGTSDPLFDLAPDGGDGQVDINDMLELLTLWGPCR
jgi:hypothetical protein